MIKCIVVGSVVMGLAGVAMADGTVLMTAPGGAFHADVQTGYLGITDANGEFDTFCIEHNEFFTPGTTYFARLSNAAEFGGEGGGNPDPVSSRTSLLYRTYRDGGLIDGVLVNDDTEENNLQLAIWASEDENGGYALLTGQAQDFYDWAEDNNNGSQYGVRAMQLWNDAGYTSQAQDMLTIVPLPPAAWAGLGSLAMLMGVGQLRRRTLRS